MNFEGLEIDMLAVGDADCFLVTQWNEGVPTRILVDGGKRSHARMIRSFLRSRGINRIDHVVNSHFDADHAGGLIPLIEDETIQWGQAWMHVPAWHVHPRSVQYKYAESANLVTASLKHSKSLLKALDARDIPVEEPFAGTRIGFMTVCGPSKAYYKELLGDFKNLDQYIEQLDKQDSWQLRIKNACKRLGIEDEPLLASPMTTPANNSSVILHMVYGNRKYLLTADAGVDALRRAAETYHLKNLYWMQLPHHGSYHNMAIDLVEHFSPSIGYVSASGNEHHPGLAVVNAFKRNGAIVYGTHYPSVTNIWHHSGRVPPRPSYAIRTPI